MYISTNDYIMIKSFHLLFALLFAYTMLNAQESSLKDKILGEKKMPDIVLDNILGKKVHINQLHQSGKYTVISFWATWCVPCKKELNNIADLYEEWQKKYNMQLVAVSIDDSRSAPRVKPYVDGQRWEYEVVLDVNSDVKRSLNIQNVPFTLVLDKEGKIIYDHSGYQEGDEHALEDFLAKLPN